MTSSTMSEFSVGTVTIRRLGAADRGEVELLAQLDSSRAPDGPLLGTIVEGRLLAVTSLETGETIADPFSRTGELEALLQLRVAQIGRRSDGQRRRFSLRSALPARAALAGSPPGSGGRLLSLLPR